MSRTILVVGGYGAVGDPLCRTLAGAGFRPVIAGRNPQKGVSLAYQLDTATRRLDLGEAATWDAALEGVDLVVMCVDQTHTGFAEHVFARGLHYVDVTASDAFFRQLEALPRPDKSAALLSVGLAPGLTNMLARALALAFDRVTRIDIGLLFGLGDHHGAAGLDWMADRIFEPQRPRDPRLHDFGPAVGTRAAHVVDFSDQHALMRTMPGAKITTRVAFDSRFVTAALFGAASWFPGNGFVCWLARRSFGAVHLGSRTVSVSIEATGYRGDSLARSSVRFAAEGESRTTARLAALMIRLLLERPPAPGIWHSHQMLDPAQFADAVQAEGIGTIDWTLAPAYRRPSRVT